MAEKLEVTVQSRSGKDLGLYTFSLSSTLSDLKAAIHSHRAPYLDPRLHPTRQWLTLDSAQGQALKDDFQTLKTLGSLKLRIVVKDLGLKMSWRLVYIIEYLGPIVLFPLLLLCPALCYGWKEPVQHSQTQL
jgi:very-long-chain enoyl-CoA reductase